MPSSLRHFFSGSLNLLFSLLLSACGTIDIGERNFIRGDPPGMAPVARLDGAALLVGGRVEEEEIITLDGAVLRGLSWRPAGATRGVIYFGGNAFHLDQHGRRLLPLLASCGISVTLFDYRGYGRSSGTPGVQTLAADALRVYDHVAARTPGGVVVHGQSLGSFMAAHVAQQRPDLRGLVLEATATTVQDWVDANVPWYVRLFSTVNVAGDLRAIDNVAAVAGYHGAALVLAGGRDRITPPDLARRVFEALPGPSKRWLLTDDAGHNDLFGHKAVMPTYCNFVGS
ncbi:MAG: alpha/beta fold hydrolase [Pseudomonadota bacterium]